MGRGAGRDGPEEILDLRARVGRHRHRCAAALMLGAKDSTDRTEASGAGIVYGYLAPAAVERVTLASP
jgi:hypothetical protein